MKTAEKSALDELSQATLFQKVGNICSAANSVTTTKQLLEVSLKQTMDLFQATRGSIFILNDNGKDLTLKTAHGMKNDEREKMVKRMGEGIVGKVAELKQPVFVEDISTDHRFQNFKARNHYRTPSFICAPLMIKDKLIGVINIADKESGHRFTKDEMQLLDFATTQIALNYYRLQLYQKFKKIIKEKRSLKDKLGQTDEETKHLRKQIIIHEKLATIGKLAGGIAHEFNNPLDGVMRYTSLCLDHVKDDEVLRGYLLEIKHGLNRMVNIVKNLLACSRNEFPTRQTVNFEYALERALVSKQMDIEHKNIVVEKIIENNLPPIQDLGLDGILTNLIRNAVDAIVDKGKITIRVKHENNKLIFSVSDTGRGIPAEDIGRIFEPFFTTKDMDKGCGLGLTVTGEIVKSYHGKISVESDPGKGSTFIITLPVDDVEHAKGH